MNTMIINVVLITLFAVSIFPSEGLFGQAIPVATKKPVALVDNFEDGDLKRSPSWWQFGGLYTEIVQNDQEVVSYLDPLSLSVTGRTSSGYIGGCGTYFGIDGTQYDTLKLVIHSSKKSKGVMRVELYDDDNGTWSIEKDPSNPSSPGFDDKYIYNLSLDWDGWRVVTIPFDQFYDQNPAIGDGVWNPDQKNGSGGLLQMQFIFLSDQTKGYVDVQIDTIKFFKDRV